VSFSAEARAKRLREEEEKALGINQPAPPKKQEPKKPKPPKVKIDPAHKKTREEAIAAQQAADRAAIKAKRKASGDKEEFWVQ
jgi:hypothetical protein